MRHAPLLACLSLLGGCTLDFDPFESATDAGKQAARDPDAGDDASVATDASDAAGGAADAAPAAGRSDAGERGDAATSRDGGPMSACEGGVCTPSEDCLNDRDDDGDGDIDCADDDCDQVVCTPDAPDGWLGPFALYDGEPGAAPEACPDGSEEVYRGYAGLSADPLTCGCTCAAPGGGTCTYPELSTWESPGCTGVMWTTALGSCATLPSASLTPSFRVGPVAPLGGACAAVASEAEHPEPEWQLAALGCQPKTAFAGGCGGKAPLCLPRARSPFAMGACVLHSGDVSCPDSVYRDKHVYQGKLADTRSCAEACSCSAPSGRTCGGKAWLLDAACNAVPGVVAEIRAGSEQTECYSASSAVGGVNYNSDEPAGGECEATVSAPTGGVSAILPSTVCCMR